MTPRHFPQQSKSSNPSGTFSVPFTMLAYQVPNLDWLKKQGNSSFADPLSCRSVS